MKTRYLKTKDKRLAKQRTEFRKALYGLEYPEYLQMIANQNNCCAICNLPETRKIQNMRIKPLSVDHNHQTGKIRGLLCNSCNSMIGFAKEDIGRLSRAIDYLNHYK